MFCPHAYFDGAASGNPGLAGIGYAVFDAEGNVLHEYSEQIGIATNNEAEYRALIALVKKLLEERIKEVIIMGDSQLVVNQVNGMWRVNQPHLQRLYEEVCELLSGIPNWELKWVSRKKNTIADKLSKMAVNSTYNSQPREFHGKIEKVTDSIYLAFGTKVYAVDLENNACTCPAFVNKRTRPCKHLLAVRNRICGS